MEEFAGLKGGMSFARTLSFDPQYKFESLNDRRTHEDGPQAFYETDRGFEMAVSRQFATNPLGVVDCLLNILQDLRTLIEDNAQNLFDHEHFTREEISLKLYVIQSSLSASETMLEQFVSEGDETDFQTAT